MTSRDYKFEVMISFWFALHLEKVEECRLIYEQDSIIEKILKSLREKGRLELELKQKKEK